LSLIRPVGPGHISVWRTAHRIHHLPCLRQAMQSNAARLFLLVSCVTCICVGHSGQHSPTASQTFSKRCHLQTHSVLALRGGNGDEERQRGADDPDTLFGEEVSPYGDQDPVAEARMQIGRLLDDMAPYWTVDDSVETPKVYATPFSRKEIPKAAGGRTHCRPIDVQASGFMYTFRI